MTEEEQRNGIIQRAQEFCEGEKLSARDIADLGWALATLDSSAHCPTRRGE